MKKFVFPLAAAILSLGVATSSAFAFDCHPANKPTGAGSAGTYNVQTDTFIPSNKNATGGFITIDTGTATFDVFQHPHNGVLPAGALNSGPGNNLCDGKGIDDSEACGFFGAN